jgi:phosphoribosylanthranilate isomerase
MTARPPLVPKVKVCGITRPEDAALAAALGADYLGLNFFPGSPRCIGLGQAREIASAAGEVPLVGVFVDRPASEVEEIASAAGLDLLQFSGDEEPAAVGRFGPRALKAFRTGGDPGAAALAPWAGFWGLLIDARHGALYGGTGLAWSFGEVARIAAGRRVFVAGGLGPDNVRRAAAASGAYGLDVCSRVESAPGIKDRVLLERLFEEVRHAQGTAT